jgi:hypothetical protein
MKSSLLHVYRNTSMGRETYLHSLYFCKKLNIALMVYIPPKTHFSMNLDNIKIRIDLDESYLNSPNSAVGRVKGLAKSNRVDVSIISEKSSCLSGLPDLHKAVSFMTCPRSISDLSSRIRLGFIGARVRQIVQAARFPVLITSPVFKPWKNITVLFGGSENSLNALRFGIHIAKRTGLPLNMLTYIEQDPSFYRNAIAAGGLTQDVKLTVADWHHCESGNFEENLYAVHHNSLVIVGAYGHGRVKEVLFGSKLEIIQATLTNNLLVAGPRVRIPSGFHQVPETVIEPEILKATARIDGPA